MANPPTKAELKAQKLALEEEIDFLKGTIYFNTQYAKDAKHILDSGQTSRGPASNQYLRELRLKRKTRLERVTKDKAALTEARAQLDEINAQLDGM